MEHALVEVGFMMFVLKIPILYLFGVVWWAVRAEPRDEHPVAAAAPRPCPWDRGRRPSVPRGGSPRARAARRSRVPA